MDLLAHHPPGSFWAWVSALRAFYFSCSGWCCGLSKAPFVVWIVNASVMLFPASRPITAKVFFLELILLLFGFAKLAAETNTAK
jgi:hypothetical protein